MRVVVLLSLFLLFSGCVVAEYYDYAYYTDEHGTHKVPVRRSVIVPDLDAIGDFLLLGALIYGLSRSKVRVYHYDRAGYYRQSR